MTCVLCCAVVCCVYPATGKLEWASHDLSTIFIQRSNMFKPSFLRMVMDVIRFGREAPQVSTGAGRESQGQRRLFWGGWEGRNGCWMDWALDVWRLGCSGSSCAGLHLRRGNTRDDMRSQPAQLTRGLCL